MRWFLWRSLMPYEGDLLGIVLFGSILAGLACYGVSRDFFRLLLHPRFWALAAFTFFMLLFSVVLVARAVVVSKPIAHLFGGG
jgi:hypothetical protein